MTSLPYQAGLLTGRVLGRVLDVTLTLGAGFLSGVMDGALGAPDALDYEPIPEPAPFGRTGDAFSLEDMVRRAA